MSHHPHQCLHVQVGGIEHIGSAPKHPSLPSVSKVKLRALWIVSLTRYCLFSLDCLPHKWIIKYLSLHNWLASLSTKSSRFNSLPSDFSFSLLCGCRSMCSPVYAESESYDGLSHHTAPHCGLSSTLALRTVYSRGYCCFVGKGLAENYHGPGNYVAENEDRLLTTLCIYSQVSTTVVLNLGVLTLSQRSNIRYAAYQILIWFISVAKLQLRSSSEIILWLGFTTMRGTVLRVCSGRTVNRSSTAFQT